MRQWWQQRAYGKRTLSVPALLLALSVAVLVTTPLGYVLLRAVNAEASVWERLLQTRVWGLLGNTLALVGAVTTGAMVLGVGLAWLVERTNVPGRGVWRWLLAVPLAIPPFIGAVVHVALLRPRGGLLPQTLTAWGLEMPLPSPFGFWGAAFILSLFMYPYVFLLSSAAFRGLHASLEEAARSLGRNLWQTLWQVTLPALRPGLSAGALLVALDVLAEYGTVALLRFNETFSAAIFLQLSGRYDRSAAAALSLVLVVLALIFLFAELRLQGQRRYDQMTGQWRPAPVMRLGAWRWPAFGLLVSVSAFTVWVPVAMLLFWTVQGWQDASFVAQVYRFESDGLGGYFLNSVGSAGLAAVLAVVLSLPVAYLSARYPRTTSRLISRLCQVGYAVPGVVVALSLVLLVNQALPFLYGTPLVVVLAYVVRHMPQAVRASESALNQVPPSLEEAARALGRPPLMAFAQVTLPLIFPGLLAGGALVFLTSLKELPATLLLRPAGFDTLAVRVWVSASDGIYTQAAPAALLLMVCAALPLAFILSRRLSNH